jgi:predicted transposase/invertase (TIGR01784 family)
LDEQELAVLKQFMYKVLHPMARSISRVELGKVINRLIDDGKDGEEMVSSLSRKLYKEALALEKKGREEGRKETQSNIAQRMLREGFDIDVVMKISGLSQEEVKTLKEANTQQE